MCSSNSCDQSFSSFGRFCFDDASCPDHPAIMKRRRYKSRSSSNSKLIQNTVKIAHPQRTHSTSSSNVESMNGSEHTDSITPKDEESTT
mmetsp:Transcript_55191/g.88048  ORF Transcript_55191/g.88048 Transcript_55191/m.88048 type:complete len:89 (+) Transcript_55191:23-289(+)